MRSASTDRGSTSGDDRTAKAAVAQRLAGHPRGLVPARAQIPPGAQVDLFVAQATEQSATVKRVADRASVPAAVVEYLKAENLPAAVRMAPDLLPGSVSTRNALPSRQANRNYVDTGLPMK